MREWNTAPNCKGGKCDKNGNLSTKLQGGKRE